MKEWGKGGAIKIPQATTPFGAFIWAYPFVGNVYTMSAYKDAIKNNHPPGLLLADGIDWL